MLIVKFPNEYKPALKKHARNGTDKWLDAARDRCCSVIPHQRQQQESKGFESDAVLKSIDEELKKRANGGEKPSLTEVIAIAIARFRGFD